MASPSVPVPSTEGLTLLTLPPEVRNRIYREVLVLPDEIYTFRTDIIALTESPLLATCHQVRDEASSIYYKENTFTFEVSDYNADVYIRWCRAKRARFYAQVDFRIEHGARNWPNLMVWVTAWAHGDCRAPAPDSTTMGGVFALVRNARPHVSTWGAMEVILASVRKTLASEHAAWAEGSWEPDSEDNRVR